MFFRDCAASVSDKLRCDPPLGDVFGHTSVKTPVAHWHAYCRRQSHAFSWPQQRDGTSFSPGIAPLLSDGRCGIFPSGVNS
ncbi:hypothetical protein CY34DRAFT_142018 [Suillus luteus UH-Slu-Lm8-n1]|uniref:Uncharacterized protein n=1 Tax=Suillus luteus UH-Slu-Lm8-n1 TaxID=930992 RepID=A0A0D0AKX0_9AGAM|nr:hypothetical protein CY34DRAFT_142018 [Suillus luteus UH-Slu-Lm8-n1]